MFQFKVSSQFAKHVVCSIVPLDNLAIILSTVCGVIFLVIMVACIYVYRAKRKKAFNTEADDGIPLSTITNSASQLTANPYPPPPVGTTPGSTNPAASSSSNPNPKESPPPYPEEENVPQYPPPGELYPWQQQ